MNFKLLLLITAVCFLSGCQQWTEQESNTSLDSLAADNTMISADSSSIDSIAVADSVGEDSSTTLADTIQPAQPAISDSSEVSDSTQTESADSAATDSSTSIADIANNVAPGSGSLINSVTKRVPDISLSFWQIFMSIAFFFLALIIIRYSTNFLEALAERWTNLRLTVKRTIPVFRIIAWTITFYIILVDIIRLPVETLIAFTASAGIAIGFASQDILKNIFGGLMLLLDRPFQVGDKIEAAGHYGEVMQIGLRTVRIVTPDDNLVSIPNGEIMNQAVSNANAGENNCQVVAEFFLPADIDVAKVKKVAFRAAAVSRYVFLNKPIAVIFKNEIHQGRSLLKMRLKAYVLDIRYEFPFSSEMTETVIRELFRQELITPTQMAMISNS